MLEELSNKISDLTINENDENKGMEFVFMINIYML